MSTAEDRGAAYVAGILARNAETDANPYYLNTPQWIAWHSGWQDQDAILKQLQRIEPA